MRAVFARELRRLAPFALGLLLVTGLFVLVANRTDGPSPHDALWIMSVLTAGILSVATVAPDTDSGAVAFLARLPIAPGRVIAAKLAAAALWNGPMLVLGFAIYPGYRLERGLLEIAVAFGAGALASVAVRRTLPAALLTPILAMGAFVLVALPAELFFDVYIGRSDSMRVLYAGFTVTSLLLGALAYVRGDRHRASWRPALIAVGGLLLTCSLAVGSIATAHQLAVRDSVHWLRVTSAADSPDGRRFAVALAGSHWAAYETRVAVVDRTDRSTWLVPLRHVGSPELSPDGRKLLVRNMRESGGAVVDLETRSVVRLRAPFGDAYDGFGAEGVLWKDGEPAFVRDKDGRIEVRAAGGRAIATLPLAADGKLVVAHGERIYLLDGRGLEWRDPWSGASGRTDLVPGATPIAATLSPSGRSALVLAERPGTRGELARIDLATGETSAFEVDANELGGFQHASFAPDESALVLMPSDSTAYFVDLAHPGVRSFEWPEQGPWTDTRRVAWTRDGREAALPWGRFVDRTTGASRPGQSHIVTFVDPSCAVCSSAQLAFVDAVSGAVSLRPFEER